MSYDDDNTGDVPVDEDDDQDAGLDSVDVQSHSTRQVMGREVPTYCVRRNKLHGGRISDVIAAPMHVLIAAQVCRHCRR